MTALILVDIQNDFMPGGSLPVPKGDEIIPVIAELLKCRFEAYIATKDWHPENHQSFAVVHNKKVGEKINIQGLNQILWPIHCVQGTPGSNFAPGWEHEKMNKIIYKGTNTELDSYSAFFDNAHLKSTELENYLRSNNINRLYFAGLATDYCVKYSVIDACRLGFSTFVITDACRGINPDDSKNALKEMEEAGAILIDSQSIQRSA